MDAELKQQQNQSILHTQRHLTGVQPGTQGLLITEEPTPKDRHETTHSMWSSLITKEKQQTEDIIPVAFLSTVPAYLHSPL